MIGCVVLLSIAIRINVIDGGWFSAKQALLRPFGALPKEEAQRPSAETPGLLARVT